MNFSESSPTWLTLSSFEPGTVVNLRGSHPSDVLIVRGLVILDHASVICNLVSPADPFRIRQTETSKRSESPLNFQPCLVL